MIALTITGHSSVSDWSFLVALVAFLVVLALTITRARSSPPQGTTGTPTGTLVAVLPWLGWSALALGLLVV